MMVFEVTNVKSRCFVRSNLAQKSMARPRLGIIGYETGGGGCGFLFPTKTTSPDSIQLFSDAFNSFVTRLTISCDIDEKLFGNSILSLHKKQVFAYPC